MRIGGYEKLSTIDYPGKMTCAIFLVGCNFNCGYCHNPSLIKGDGNYIDKEEVMKYLIKRKNMLEAVCISGGEPTCSFELKSFISEIKSLGYLVKLDTNGTHPEVLQELLDEKLLDYIAMDIKASYKKYQEVAGCKVDMDCITKSIQIIQESGIDHEFRTTFIPTLDKDDITEITTKMIKNDKYFLQQFRNKITNDVAYHEYIPHQVSYITETANMVKNTVGMCGIRGI